MKLAVSHIAWLPQEDDAALSLLARHGYAGVEVAPTRVAGEGPYEKPEVAAAFAAAVKQRYGLAVCSLQSIWFGCAGSMFGPEQADLLAYTQKAILFAQAAGAGNLVFGNPKNRVRPQDVSADVAVPFFRELGDFASQHQTVLALEANPPVYGTNYMNATPDAFAVAAQVNSAGCGVNLDVGTMVIQDESADMLAGKVDRINHVHISEPGLAMIEERPLHRALAERLRREGYEGYVSIEMKQQPLENVERAVQYVAEVFG